MNPLAIPFSVVVGSILLIFIIKLVKLPPAERLLVVVFTISSLIFGFYVILGSETYARYSVNFESISYASHESLREMLSNPMLPILDLIPFAVIGVITAALSKEGKIKQGCCMIAGGLVPVTYWYVNGNVGIQHALQKHAWTAAALSAGFMPFMSLPSAIGGLFAGYLFSRLLDKLKI